ncbi:hypothetical protein N783_15370 [Pontibacillus marinus BH030004 = DSM 16465]|uniref:Uncharacterized protein n=1 Tax=Pontibacillus marinus BH030004 = DSM 16465 TaxID=1385511 RepID=A0A0A5G1N9_9BACI|nr:hypothetical protein N783_15370 [Pontibacillus marinus BH030004 = DSM 16465]
MAPKEQTLVNLSGKKTLVGRTSGECLTTLGHPRSKQSFTIVECAYITAKLSGEWTGNNTKGCGFSVFLMPFFIRLAKKVMNH